MARKVPDCPVGDLGFVGEGRNDLTVGSTIGLGKGGSRIFVNMMIPIVGFFSLTGATTTWSRGAETTP